MALSVSYFNLKSVKDTRQGSCSKSPENCTKLSLSFFFNKNNKVWTEPSLNVVINTERIMSGHNYSFLVSNITEAREVSVYIAPRMKSPPDGLVHSSCQKSVKQYTKLISKWSSKLGQKGVAEAKCFLGEGLIFCEQKESLAKPVNFLQHNTNMTPATIKRRLSSLGFLLLQWNIMAKSKLWRKLFI